MVEATTARSSATTRQRVAALLKISKPTFWLIWATPFIYAYLGSASTYNWLVFLPNVVAICILEAAICIHNDYVDRAEDTINQPNRVKLAETAGYGTMKKLFISGYAEIAIPVGGENPNMSFLSKPFHPSVLTDRVRQILNGGRFVQL